MGESTHGTREFFLLKHRLLEFLVREMGCRAWAMEASESAALAPDASVGGAPGDAARLVHARILGRCADLITRPLQPNPGEESLFAVRDRYMADAVTALADGAAVSPYGAVRHRIGGAGRSVESRLEGAVTPGEESLRRSQPYHHPVHGHRDRIHVPCSDGHMELQRRPLRPSHHGFGDALWLQWRAGGGSIGC